MPDRVYFVLTGLAPTGGVRATFELADALRQLGVDASVVAQSRSLRSRLAGAVRRTEKDIPDWFRRGRTGVRHFDLRGGKFPWSASDLVIAVGTFSIELLREAQLPGRVVRFCHGFADHLPEATSKAWGGGTPTIAVTNALLDRLRELGGTRIVGVVPNGLDPGFLERSPDNMVDARTGVGAVFSDHPIKRPELILQTYEQLRSDLPQATLLGFGASRLPRNSARVAYTLGAGVAAAVGLYSQSRVWFVASQNEGFGLPIIEAMACGAVVVAGSFPAAFDLIEEPSAGRIFKVDHPECLAETVCRAFMDVDSWTSGFASRVQFARSFTWRRSAEEFSRLLL